MLKSMAQMVSRRSRQAKFRQFMSMMQPNEETSVLDVGVTNSGYNSTERWSTENFFEAMYPWPQRITAVGLHDFSKFRSAFPTVTCVTGDGRSLPFPDKSFDIAFSNAVVEHVGELEDQQLFISELCRVARRIFVTTPSLLFPIEVHTLLPLVHWLPKQQRDSIFTRLGKAHACHVRLLSPREFQSLFPLPIRLLNNGMTLIAVNDQYPDR